MGEIALAIDKSYAFLNHFFITWKNNIVLFSLYNNYVYLLSIGERNDIYIYVNILMCS